MQDFRIVKLTRWCYMRAESLERGKGLPNARVWGRLLNPHIFGSSRSLVGGRVPALQHQPIRRKRYMLCASHILVAN